MTKRNFAPALCGMLLCGALLMPVGLQARYVGQETADKAGNKLSDRDLMRHIRHDVVSDKGISTNGHNVKIIADHGKVTLRGEVRSDEEKSAIEEHARKYAGDGQVANELTVTNSH